MGNHINDEEFYSAGGQDIEVIGLQVSTPNSGPGSVRSYEMCLVDIAPYINGPDTDSTL